MADCTTGITAPLSGLGSADVEVSLAASGTLAFRVAMKLLRHREDAEDVAQEAFVRALKRFPSLRDRTRFQAWLVRVAWRLAIDRLRSDSRRASRDQHFVAPEYRDATAEQALIAREQQARLLAAIDDLPETLREPLILSGLQGQSVEEIAERLRLPAGTVKSRSFEARRRLKKALTAGAGLVLLGTLIKLSMPAGLPVEHTPDWTEVEAVAQTSSSTIPARPIPAPAIASPRRDSGEAAQLTTVVIKPIEVAVIALPTVQFPSHQIPVVEVPVVQIPVAEVPVVNGTLPGSGSGHQEK